MLMLKASKKMDFISQTKKSPKDFWGLIINRNYFMDVSIIAMLDMAGLAGFEPAHDGTKTRCLTTWLQPIAVLL